LQKPSYSQLFVFGKFDRLPCLLAKVVCPAFGIFN